MKEKTNFWSREGVRAGTAFSAMICVYIVLSFVGQIVSSGDGVAAVAARSTFSLISLAAVICFFSLSFKRNLLEIAGVKKFSLVYIIVAVALAAGMFLGLGFVNTLFGDFLKNEGLNVPQTKIPLDDGWQLTLFVLLTAILPAIIEESFFRGLILGELGGGKILPSIFSVGFIFALYHCSAVQFFYQFAFGVALSFLTVRSGSSVPSMIAHFINNFVVLLLTYLGVGGDFLLNPFCIACGLLILAASVIFAVFYKRKKRDWVDVTDGKKLFASFYILSAVGAVFSLFIIISNLVA